MKRILSLMAALFVCASNCFAWSAESFIGNDYDHYSSDQDEYQYYSSEFEQPVVMMLPRTMSVSPAAEMVDSTQVYSLDLSAPDVILNNLDGNVGYKWSLWGSYHTTILDVPYNIPVYRDFTSGTASFDSNNQYFNFFGYPDTTVSYDFREYDTGSYYWDGYSHWTSCGIYVSYDIPVPADTYGISFSPVLNIFGRHSFNGTQTDRLPAYGQLFINGAKVLEFSSNSYAVADAYTKESSFTYTEPIQSVQFVLYSSSGQFTAGLPSDSKLNGTAQWHSRLWYRDTNTVKFGFLSSDQTLGLNNDMAQNDINDHNALESEWTGSMTQNFDALNVSSFSYPSGLLSGFGLLTGIFNDLWNGLGEYKILYVFPLTLGIVLVLVGKMSRYSGRASARSSGSGKSGGD